MSESAEPVEYPVVRVFSFKEGLLSRFAHDLQIALTDFEIELSEGRVVATFRTAGVVVEGAVREGKLDPKLLSGSDCRKILDNISKDVLDSKRYPEARYEATVSEDSGGLRLDGSLTMVGRRVACPTVRPVDVGGAWIARLQIVPSRWGIRPYKAMGGALKIQDAVRIEVALPAEAGMDHQRGQRRWQMRPA